MEQHMQVGGQDRPYHVGTNQGEIFCRLQNLTLVGYGKLLSDLTQFGFGARRDLVFSALKAGYERVGMRLDFTHLTVGDWMDAPDYDEVATVGAVIEALGAQFEQRAAYQAEQAAKNAPAPSPEPAPAPTPEPAPAPTPEPAPAPPLMSVS